MERYEYAIVDQLAVKIGSKSHQVHQKHINSYGAQGAAVIRDNVVPIFQAAIEQLANPTTSNNLLLVGKVQSGKTSNLELITALAMDNGFNLIVIYGGYDLTLLNQTAERFRDTFDAHGTPSLEDQTPWFVSSDDSGSFESIDQHLVQELWEAGKPLFLICMKRPHAMRELNNLLARIKVGSGKVLIIDDEGDQASLNNEKNKQEDSSPTYDAICKLKDLTGDPLYLSVTATPQALVFLDEYSRLRPADIRVIQPGKGYCGADLFHLYAPSTVYEISDSSHSELEQGRLPQSMRAALEYYILASAIMRLRGINYSDMILHAYREVDIHGAIYGCIDAYLKDVRSKYMVNDVEALGHWHSSLEKQYYSFFSTQVIEQYSFSAVIQEAKSVVDGIYLVLHNSAGGFTKENLSLRRHKIYIGGDLLQRGVTFPNLIVSYFTRWAKTGGNMDTNLQRARWLGYRSKILDLCKLFTTSDIAEEYTYLAESEIDLWEQFEQIEGGSLEMDSVVVRTSGNQKPTRPSVANYKTVAFTKRWVTQRTGVWDLNALGHHNAAVEQFMAGQRLEPTSAARADDKASAYHCMASSQTVVELVKELSDIFALSPFGELNLIDLIERYSEVSVINMTAPNDIRRRSFRDDHTVKQLMQGPDESTLSKARYLGDRKLIVRDDTITLQVHKIKPIKLGDKDIDDPEKYIQHMFALYVPTVVKYFSRS